MNPRTMYQVTLAVCALSLLLSVTNGIMLNKSRHLQEQVNLRAAQIQAGNTFAQVFQGLVQVLAKTAIDKKDQQLRALLTENGFKFNDAAGKPAAAPEAKPAASKKQ